jgi:hypothetical protein
MSSLSGFQIPESNLGGGSQDNAGLHHGENEGKWLIRL